MYKSTTCSLVYLFRFAQPDNTGPGHADLFMWNTIPIQQNVWHKYCLVYINATGFSVVVFSASNEVLLVGVTVCLFNWTTHSFPVLVSLNLQSLVPKRLALFSSKYSVYTLFPKYETASLFPWIYAPLP